MDFTDHNNPALYLNYPGVYDAILGLVSQPTPPEYPKLAQRGGGNHPRLLEPVDI